MLGATKRQGESPVEHARCGLPPRTANSSVVCPSCLDVCTRKSLREAVSAWNEMQRGIVSAAKTNAERQRDFRQRKIDERKEQESQGLRCLELYAHPDDWPAIKMLAEKLHRKRQKHLTKA